MPAQSRKPGERRDGKSRHRYANHLSAKFSLSEVELGFGQRFGAGGHPQVQMWLVTSPVHLVRFGRIIGETIAGYQSRYGPIPDASEAGPSAGTTRQ